MQSLSASCPSCLRVSNQQSPSAKGLQSSVFSLQSENLHVVLGFAYPDAVAMAPICQKLNLPYSVLVLGSDFRVRMTQPKFRPLVLDCLRQAPRIFCPGQALAHDIAEAGIDPDKIHPFNNGVDAGIFFADDTPRKNEILFVGNLVPVKAPDRIIRAFHGLTNERAGGLRLVMAGSGPLRASLQRLAQQLEIPSDQIEWVGSVSQMEVANRMRAAKLLCLCSKSEGMPNVVREACACGCPVVATDVGEIPYMLNVQNGIAISSKMAEDAMISSLREAVVQSLNTKYDHAGIAEAAGGYSWLVAARGIAGVIRGS